MAPVIPGSSLKGSIRTAILNAALDETYMRDKLPRDDRRLQQELLDYKDAKQDPFHAVQIGDCKFLAKGTQLVGLVKNVM